MASPDPMEEIAKRSINLEKSDKRDINTVIHDFNKKTFTLLNFCQKRCPKDTNILRIKDLMSTAKSFDEKVIIEEAGPFFIQFSHIILDKKRLITLDEIISICAERTNDESIHELVTDLFKVIFNEYMKLSEANQMEIREKLILLMDDYLCYCNKL